MPLSEHEQRLLDQIEQTLRVDDPRLALSLRSARPQARTHTFVIFTICGLLAGIGLLIAGLRLSSNAGTVLGVVGFACLVAAADCALRVVTQVRAHRRRDPSTESV